MKDDRFLDRDPKTLTGREIGEAFDEWPLDERPGCLFGLAIGFLRSQGFTVSEIRTLMNETLDDVLEPVSSNEPTN